MLKKNLVISVLLFLGFCLLLTGCNNLSPSFPEVAADSDDTVKENMTFSRAATGSSVTVNGFNRSYCDSFSYLMERNYIVSMTIRYWESVTNSSFANATNVFISDYTDPWYFMGNGWYNFYASVTATPHLPSPPPVPASLSITNLLGTYAAFSWSASAGATGYKIYLNGVYQKSTTSTSSYLNTLSPNTSYTLSVSAYNNAGESGKRTISFKTVNPVPVSISGPSVLTGNISPVWTVNIPGSIQNYSIHYTVQRGTEPPFSWDSTSTICTFSPGSPGQTLKIQVTVTAPGYTPGTASFTAVNSYGM